MLMKIGQIVELYPLFGEYDLIAKVEADSYEAIGAVVMSKIRSIEGVKATKTLARIAFQQIGAPQGRDRPSSPTAQVMHARYDRRPLRLIGARHQRSDR